MNEEKTDMQGHAKRQVVSWIHGRIQRAVAKPGQWDPKLQTWGTCLHNQHKPPVSGHYNEPPPPMATGYMAMTTVNFKEVAPDKCEALGTLIHWLLNRSQGRGECYNAGEPEMTMDQAVAEFRRLAEEFGHQP